MTRPARRRRTRDRSAPSTARSTDPWNVDAALKSAATVVSASYGYHYQSHAPIGPQVAVADVTPNGARIFTYAQGVSGVPAQVASAIGLPATGSVRPSSGARAIWAAVAVSTRRWPRR